MVFFSPFTNFDTKNRLSKHSEHLQSLFFIFERNILSVIRRKERINNLQTKIHVKKNDIMFKVKKHIFKLNKTCNIPNKLKTKTNKLKTNYTLKNQTQNHLSSSSLKKDKKNTKQAIQKNLVKATKCDHNMKKFKCEKYICFLLPYFLFS